MASSKRVVQVGNGGDFSGMHPDIVPNQWRVITVAPDEGEATPDTFYVMRNPPMVAFANDERGGRRAFATYDSAQIVADNLNATRG